MSRRDKITGIVLRIINKDLNKMGALLNFKNNMKWYAASVKKMYQHVEDE
ncbi:MAG: hypothetical protein HDQ95_08300 [Roseburia sp.]|nr:hypothetical protein [Roseburia sp.]